MNSMIMAVEVFKTNVCEPRQCDRLVRRLQKHLPGSRINFDLEDIDNVLRVEAQHVAPEAVIALLQKQGYACEVLE